MAIGEHQPKKAQNRCWRDGIAVLPEEVTTALEESITGLSDPQVRHRPLPPGRNSTRVKRRRWMW